jgi:hypothetical protein
MANGPSEEFADFDSIKVDEEDNNDFDVEQEFEEDNDIGHDFEESDTDPSLSDSIDDLVDDDEFDNSKIDTPAKESFLKKHKGLLIFMGVGATVVFGGIFALMPSSPTQKQPQKQVSNFNNNAQTQNDPVSQPTDNGFVGNAQNNMDANSQLPQPVQPVQTTIVKGLDEEDVLNLVEPMGRQINALIDAVSQQNEYIQTLPTKVDEVSSSLSDENLSIIKGAIDTGLKRTEDSFKEDTAQLRIEIEALAKKIQKLETKPAQEQRRQMTMVTSIEGKVRVQIDGTDEIQEIVNGSVLRGYGKVDKVGPWGCLYLEGGGTYEPTRASCAPQN